MDKLLFRDEFTPKKEDAVRSILDYSIDIFPLSSDEMQYSALNMNYSVAGFKVTSKASMQCCVKHEQ
jgi:hypothetical protein